LSILLDNIQSIIIDTFCQEKAVKNGSSLLQAFFIRPQKDLIIRAACGKMQGSDRRKEAFPMTVREEAYGLIDRLPEDSV
jgi:hypothetical protein